MKRFTGITAAGFVAVVLNLFIAAAAAEGITVAVASNFADAARALVERFERQTGHAVTLVFGSTGKHYAQIVNGAPFDAFFAADVKRPKLLEANGLALRGSRFAYAVGKLVLWSPNPGTVDRAGAVLDQGRFRHLALANPKLAPYGRAARETLESRSLWAQLQGKIVRGENIGQTFQFVRSGNAELGFVAWSQIKRPALPVEGSWWDIPQSLYSPIEQQAVLLQDNPAARNFLNFVRDGDALGIIRSYGYGTP